MKPMDATGAPPPPAGMPTLESQLRRAAGHAAALGDPGRLRARALVRRGRSGAEQRALGGVLGAAASGPAAQLSLLLASVFAGGAIGAPLLGWWRTAMGGGSRSGALLVLAVTSLLAAASTDMFWLTISARSPASRSAPIRR